MLTKWKYKAGIEMTFQKKCKTKSQLDAWVRDFYLDFGSKERAVRTIHTDKRAMRTRLVRSLYSRAHGDPDCLECPTKILTSWPDAKRTIKRILKVASEIPLVAKNRKISTGGGGHVHVSGMDELTKYAVVRDMQNRPYVPWFFADPDTTNQANSVESQEIPLLAMSWHAILNELERRSFSTPKFIHSNIHEYGTIEFRFFDCFMSYDRYEESLAFAQAYVAWIAQRVRNKDVFPVNIHNQRDLLKQYNDYHRCVREFKQLIQDVGLPWERYKRYLTNLNERFTDERLLT